MNEQSSILQRVKSRLKNYPALLTIIAFVLLCIVPFIQYHDWIYKTFSLGSNDFKDGLAEFGKGNYDKAIYYFKKAAELYNNPILFDPLESKTSEVRLAEAYLGRHQKFGEEEDILQAIEMYKTLRLLPLYSDEILNGLRNLQKAAIEFYIGKKSEVETKRAEELCNSIAEKKKMKAEFKLCLARFDFYQEKHEEACRQYEEIINIKKQDEYLKLETAVVYGAWAKKLTKKRRLSEAISNYKRAYELYPKEDSNRDEYKKWADAEVVALSIKGIVKRANGRAIAGASIQIQGQDAGLTDNAGRFKHDIEALSTETLHVAFESPTGAKTSRSLKVDPQKKEYVFNLQIGSRVAIYDHPSKRDISYFIGTVGNYWEDILRILTNDPNKRFQPVIAIKDLSFEILKGYDSLVLPDNAVPDKYLEAVDKWFREGKKIMAFDSGVSYFAASGFFWEESKGKNGLKELWNYEKKLDAYKIDPNSGIESGYTTYAKINVQTDQAGMFSNKLPEDVKVIAVAADSAASVAIASRDIPNRGTLVFMGPTPAGFSQVEVLIRNALD